METKNTILARQKDMQHSLEKVKHLIRLIQAFNFNQATAAVVEPQGSEVRVQDGSQTAAAAPTEATAAKEAQFGGGGDRSDQQGEQGTAENKQTAAVVVVAAAVKGEVSPAPNAEGIPGSSAPAEVEVAGGNGPTESGPLAEGGAESRPAPATDSSPALMAATPSITTAAAVAAAPAAPAATTNGTPEPARSNGSPIPTPATNAATANSENKTAAVSPPQTAAEKKPEEAMTPDSGGGSSSSNSKTSEPSQHSLPALVSSLDNKK